MAGGGLAGSEAGWSPTWRVWPSHLGCTGAAVGLRCVCRVFLKAQFSGYRCLHSWRMKLCIGKQAICVMLKLFLNILVMLEQICIFKTNVAGLLCWGPELSY